MWSLPQTIQSQDGPKTPHVPTYRRKAFYLWCLWKRIHSWGQNGETRGYAQEKSGACGGRVNVTASRLVLAKPQHLADADVRLHGAMLDVLLTISCHTQAQSSTKQTQRRTVKVVVNGETSRNESQPLMQPYVCRNLVNISSQQAALGCAPRFSVLPYQRVLLLYRMPAWWRRSEKWRY